MGLVGERDGLKKILLLQLVPGFLNFPDFISPAIDLLIEPL